MTEYEFICEIVLEEYKKNGYSITHSTMSQTVREAKSLWRKMIEEDE